MSQAQSQEHLCLHDARSVAMASFARRVERAAAKAAGAQTRDLNDKICSYDPCPLVQGDVMMWRDHAHLSATFSRRLWPSMRDAVVSVRVDTLKSRQAASP